MADGAPYVGITDPYRKVKPSHAGVPLPSNNYPRDETALVTRLVSGMPEEAFDREARARAFHCLGQPSPSAPPLLQSILMAVRRRRRGLRNNEQNPKSKRSVVRRLPAGAPQDQELLFPEAIFSENRPASAMSQENGQYDQQMRQQHHRIFHGQVACAALDSGARQPDRRCWAAHLRIRTALRTAVRGHPTIRAIRRSNWARSAGVNRRNSLLQQRKAAGSNSRPTTIARQNSPRSN